MFHIEWLAQQDMINNVKNLEGVSGESSVLIITFGF